MAPIAHDVSPALTRPGAPLERLASLGPSALSDAELLSLLMSPEDARAVVSEGVPLRELVMMRPLALVALTSLSQKGADALAAVGELARRAQVETDARPRLTTPIDIYTYLRPVLAPLRHEEFHVLCLNPRNVVVRRVRVAVGGPSSCAVDPREVFAPVLAVGAGAMVIAHNHPSGDPEPSPQDVALTRQLREGARVLGLSLLDHLVVSSSGYVSFLERGLL